MRVAVVGVGAGGLATALALTERGPDSMALTLFDPFFKDPGQSARGLAYQDDHGAPLLNAPASMMSVRVGDENDFVRWLRRSRGLTSEYVPRPLFGAYLSDCLESLKRQWIRREGTLHCVPSQAIAIRRSRGRRLTVATESAQFDDFDAVFLCTGWSRRGVIAERNVFAYPIEETVRRAMNASHIGVVGTGLTAVDVVRGLLSNGYRGRITLASRRGLLPVPRAEAQVVPAILTRARLAEMTALDLRGLLHLVVREAQAQEISLEVPRRLLTGAMTTQESLQPESESARDWRALFVALCDEAMADVWHLLDGTSRRLFRRWLHPYFQSWCNPMPPATAAMIATAIASGQLVVRRGLLGADSHRLLFPNGESHVVDIIVSARLGSADAVADLGSPLIRSMVDHGMAVPDPFGGLQVSYGTWRVVDASGEHLPIYAIGSLAQGARYYVNALDSIVRTVPEAIDDAVDPAFEEPGPRLPVPYVG